MPWPLLLILVLLAGDVAAGLHRQPTGHRWPRTKPRCAGWSPWRRCWRAAAYVAAYAVVVALSMPVGVLFTSSGGLLFGTLVGGALAVAGATIGAILLFLSARSVLARCSPPAPAPSSTGCGQGCNATGSPTCSPCA